MQGIRWRIEKFFAGDRKRSPDHLEVPSVLPGPIQKVWLANIRAEERYVPQVYPGRITLFWSGDEFVGHRDTRLGWSNVAGDGLEVQVVPGNHNSVRDEPHVTVFATKLMVCLRRLQSQSTENGKQALLFFLLNADHLSQVLLHS
jgi:hypothetical protein